MKVGKSLIQVMSTFFGGKPKKRGNKNANHWISTVSSISSKKAAFFVSINKFAWISSMHPLILRDPGIQGSIRCQIHQHHIGKLIQPTQGLVDWRTTKPATLAVTLGHKRNHMSYISNTPWKWPCSKRFLFVLQVNYFSGGHLSFRGSQLLFIYIGELRG